VGDVNAVMPNHQYSDFVKTNARSVVSHRVVDTGSNQLD
jgi:hypothetical protein